MIVIKHPDRHTSHIWTDQGCTGETFYFLPCRKTKCSSSPFYMTFREVDFTVNNGRFFVQEFALDTLDCFSWVICLREYILCLIHRKMSWVTSPSSWARCRVSRWLITWCFPLILTAPTLAQVFTFVVLVQNTFKPFILFELCHILSSYTTKVFFCIIPKLIHYSVSIFLIGQDKVAEYCPPYWMENIYEHQCFKSCHIFFLDLCPDLI